MMKTRVDRDIQDTTQRVYRFPCKCGRFQFWRNRLLGVRIKEHRQNLRHSLMGKSKLAQHTYEEGQRMYWEEAKVLKIKPNNTCRKYKESVHVASVANPIAQPSLDICPI
jgi:hypothetical protein